MNWLIDWRFIIKKQSRTRHFGLKLITTESGRESPNSGTLRIRLLTAFLGLPAVLALIYAAPNDVVRWCFAALAAWTSFEFARLALVRLPPQIRQQLVFACPLLTVSTFAIATSGGTTTSLPFVAAGLIIAALVGCFIKGTIAECSIASQANLLAVGYPVLTWMALWTLYLGSNDLLLLVLVSAWASDTGAYFGGRGFGKRKMAPSLSPNKTWEGAIAGLLCSVLAVLFFEAWRAPVGDWLQTALIAVTGAAAAQTGDLFKSLFKRNAGVKEAGSLLPGHGGLIDRIDSVLLTGSVIWLILALTRPL